MYIPAAAIDSGPLIPLTSSASTKLGCAVNPASSLPSFKNLHTYFPPKQYPTPPILLHPSGPRISFIVASTMGSTVGTLGISVLIHSIMSKPSGRFSVKEIRDYDEVAVGGELIGDAGRC